MLLNLLSDQLQTWKTTTKRSYSPQQMAADGHYRRRFFGKEKKKNNGSHSYKIPNEDEKPAFLEKVKTFSGDVFQVAILTDTDKW